MSKTDSAGTTSCKRAGADVTDSLLKSTVSSTTTDYTPGVSSRVGSDSTFLHSGIKNADTQTDDGGDVSAMRRYDAFGNPMASWGGWHGPFGYGGPYGYQTDPDHGLMLLGHRYYEADTGRFLTRDPIKYGRNWYRYGNGDPLSSIDPDGLSILDVIRRGIHRGKLPPGTAGRYSSDPRFRDKVHREIGRRKLGSPETRNTDLSDEEIWDIINYLLLEWRTKPVPSMPSVGADWEAIGRGVLIGAVAVGVIASIVLSGGTAAGPALVGGAAAIGGILLTPQPKRDKRDLGGLDP